MKALPLQPVSPWSCLPAAGSTIHSEVRFFEPERRILWTGKVLTAKAIHGWALTPEPGGHTHAVVDESIDGLLMATVFPAQKLSSADASWRLRSSRRRRSLNLTVWRHCYEGPTQPS